VSVKRWGLVAVAMACLGGVPAYAQTEQEGALTFPDDESAQPVSWDYWWGAARITTTSGNRYIVGGAYTSNWEATAAGYEIFPLQGPYQHQAVMSVDGPENWAARRSPPTGSPTTGRRTSPARIRCCGSTRSTRWRRRH